MASKSLERGDTLVEVLMSVVILSIVIVGAIAMMNRGLAGAQIALEHSQARLNINGQLEMLRYARDQYVKDTKSPGGQLWSDIVSSGSASNIVYNESCSVTPAKSASAFYLDSSSTGVERNSFDPSNKPETVAFAGSGLWVEHKLSSGVTPAYIDFVVRACWPAAGSGGEQRTVTALRLYDPSR